jgi:hypothetical protein
MNAICLTVQVRIVVAGSGGSVQTVGVRRFTGMISSFLFRLLESESEPESACTIRVPCDATQGRPVRWISPCRLAFTCSQRHKIKLCNLHCIFKNWNARLCVSINSCHCPTTNLLFLQMSVLSCTEHDSYTAEISKFFLYINWDLQNFSFLQ